MFVQNPRCQPELFNIAYGVYVAKLLKEAPNKDADVVNQKLEALGYSMGKRLIDHFFATNDKIVYCKTFATAMQVVADQAFRKFLGAPAECTKWDAKYQSCSLVMG